MLGAAEVHHYRITSIDLPTQPDETRALALDLDGDGEPDNALGNVYEVVHEYSSAFEMEAPSHTRLTTDVAWMLTLYDAGAGGGGARITRGVMLDGAVMPDLGDGEPAIGPSLDGDVLAGGSSSVPLGVISDALGTSTVGWIDAPTTRVVVESHDDAGAVVTLGLGLPKTAADPVIIPNLAAFFSARLALDDSPFARDVLDADRDGVVTPAEVAANPAVKAMLAADLEQPADGGGESLGLRITASAE